MGKCEHELGEIELVRENPETGKLEPNEDYDDWEELTMAYDLNTKVLYRVTIAATFDGHWITGICPYISENGKYCRLVDGEIVEIG